MNEPPNATTPPDATSRRRLFVLLVWGAAAPVVTALGGVVSAFVLAPLRLRRGSEETRIDLGPLSAFAATRDGLVGPQETVVDRPLDDGYMTRRVKERIVLVRDASSPGGLAALSTTCTHLGCGVSWSETKKRFLCPCHGGVYDEEGRVVSGPPPRPLERLPLVIEGGRVSLDAGKLA